MIPYYTLDFILHTYTATNLQAVKSALVEFAQAIQVAQIEENGLSRTDQYKISMTVEEPTIIFDICAQFGKIKSMKIEEKASN
ncbi:MAG: hypothetical protein MUF05_00505 [Candidatus Omnitrophica bacterium]|jgi:hypothetical protein|nr:hypothetical protein [Candidatus Omnitrophota bacterium]